MAYTLAARGSLFVSSALILLLAACALPQGAGMTSQVLEGSEDPAADFAVVPVTRDTLPTISTWPGQPPQVRTAGWLPRGGGTRQEIVMAGDELSAQIWANEENGLLTLPGQRQTALPGLRVLADGTVVLPYAGSVQVANMTVEQARQAIQAKLVTIMPSAQVSIEHKTGRDNAVQVVSGLPQTGIVGLPDHDFTVLDLIAQSGGVPSTEVNPQVRVQRGGKLYGIAFNDLVQHPEQDAVLKPGDRVYLAPESRYFLAFGQSATENQIAFPQARVTALDAVSLIGGLKDEAADPKGVLVLRNYPAGAVRADGKGPSKERMIFVFDLLSADGLFSAGEFQIQDRDLVMVAQSPLLNDAAALTFVSKLLGLPQQGMNLALNARKF